MHPGPRGRPAMPPWGISDSRTTKARFMLRLPRIVILCSLPATLSSCGPPVPASSPPAASTAGARAQDRDDLDGATLLEVIERRVADSIARLRDSAVALE